MEEEATRIAPGVRAIVWPTEPTHGGRHGTVLTIRDGNGYVLLKMDGIMGPEWVDGNMLRPIREAQRVTGTPFQAAQSVMVYDPNRSHGREGVVADPGHVFTSVYLYDLEDVGTSPNSRLAPIAPLEQESQEQENVVDSTTDNEISLGDRVRVNDPGHARDGAIGRVVGASLNYSATVRLDKDNTHVSVRKDLLTRFDESGQLIPPTGPWVDQFVRDAHALADHHDMCHVVDQFLQEHGLPRRKAEYKVIADYTGTIAVTVEAASEIEAEESASAMLEGRALNDMDKAINALDSRYSSDVALLSPRDARRVG